MTNMTIVSQNPAPGDLIQLFNLDMTPIGVNQVLNFTPSNMGAVAVRFGGVTYTCVDVRAEGFESTGQGPFPRPTMAITNVAGFLSGLLYNYRDLIGAKIIRTRTYRQFLDGQASPDPTAYYPRDIYFIEQKTKHNKSVIEFVLSSRVDQQGVTLPRRKIFRDTCTHSYRFWNPNTGGFDYTGVTCPYVGTLYFNENGVATTAVNDQCGFSLSDCKKRFKNVALPTRAFPGVNRYVVQ